VKKLRQSKRKDMSEKGTPEGTKSFTPNQMSVSLPAHITLNNSENSKPSTGSSSPPSKLQAIKNLILSSNLTECKKASSDRDQNTFRGPKSTDHKLGRRNSSSEESADSDTELPSKKYEKQREQYEESKRRDNPGAKGYHRNKLERVKLKKDNGQKQDTNGKHYGFEAKRGHGRSPIKRNRSGSPQRKLVKKSEKSSKIRYHPDKYSNWR